MSMTPEEFVRACRAGEVLALAGEHDAAHDEFSTFDAPLGVGDVDDLTAEAFARGVYPLEVPWDDARAELAKLVAVGA